MTRRPLITAAALVLGGLTVVPASATLRRDPITLTRTSPSVVNFSAGVSTSDIYDLASNPGQGLDRGLGTGFGPNLHVSRLDFGAVFNAENASDNVLDVSNNEVNTTNAVVGTPNSQDMVLYFSVSPASMGVVGSDVRHQADRAQHAADRFTAGTFATPASVLQTGTPATGNGHRLSLNQTFYNAIPSVNQFSQNDYAGRAQDDADSLEVTEFKFSGQGRSFPVYFNFDALSPSLTVNTVNQTWTPADVLYTAAPGGTQDPSTPQRFAAPATMGLNGATDTLDGLALWDRGTVGVLEPGTDIALISLRNGSSFLNNRGFSGADILVTDFSGNSSLYLSHSQMGLLSSDEIDALDVDIRPGIGFGGLGLILSPIPEPTTLAAIAGLAVIGLRRRGR